MRGLSLLQPWASLIEVGAKLVETRSWKTRYRGELLIHASTGTRDFEGWWMHQPMVDALGAAGYSPESAFPFGKAIAICELVDCVEITEKNVPPEPEKSFGDYAPGRFAFKLANVRRLKKPIACKGALGLWRVGGDLAVELEHQLGVV